MDDKRFFSRVGFSYFMMVVLTVAVQFLLSLLVSLIAPQAAGLPVTSWLLAMVPLYLVAIPVCAKMMQALPNMQLYRNEMRPGQWIRTLCICIFVMYVGNIIGNAVSALIAQGITDSSLKFHLQNAKAHGVTQKEIAAIITHVAFYAGWPNGWAVFNLAKEVWDVDEGDLPYEDPAMRAHAKEMVFPIGQPNDAFAQYFIGQSYLAPVSTSQVGIFNVTFEPGCRNNWHIHHAKSGGGQILVCVAGRGYYQEEGKEAVELKPGDCINIPAEVKHWHGAAPDSWFSHLAVEVPGEETSNEWCEPVTDEEYGKLK